MVRNISLRITRGRCAKIINQNRRVKEIESANSPIYGLACIKFTKA